MLASAVGEFIVAVTEDRYSLVIELEDGRVFTIEPRAPDSHLHVSVSRRKRHTPQCVKRMGASGHCSCVERQNGESK